jgi:putative protein-disulfide isomerase
MESALHQTTHVACLFDPLCGWCYGAGPALARLALQPGIRLELVPVGLFTGEYARAMDSGFAAYAWANDQRIEQLTGQRFSQDYRSKVLQNRGQPFDSGPATLALSAVHLCAPERELEALKVIQKARYVDGEDVTTKAILVAILDGLGLETAAQGFREPDAALIAINENRLVAGQADMRSFSVEGVPALVVTRGGQRRLLRGNHLFGSFDKLLAGLAAV